MTDDSKPISYGSPDAWGGANIRAQGVRETKPIAIVGNDWDGAFIEFEEKNSAMTSEPRPFLDANSVGKEYKTRDGQVGRIMAMTDDGFFVFRERNLCWLVCANGVSINDITTMNILPPALPERRTVWLCVYDGCCSVYPSKSMADQVALLSERQGDAVPVNLERQPDGNWRVVQELTPKQKAADAMYEALSQVEIYFDNQKTFHLTESELCKIVFNAIAKAEGRE